MKQKTNKAAGRFINLPLNYEYGGDILSKRRLISGTIHDVLIPEDILLNKRKTLSDL
jgi:hypothetical protein